MESVRRGHFSPADLCSCRLAPNFAVSERSGLWQLKKSIFLPNSQNLGDAKCVEKSAVLQGILAQFYFCELRAKEFFKSHAWDHDSRMLRPPQIEAVVRVLIVLSR
jgi:hypothetical protein